MKRLAAALGALWLALAPPSHAARRAPLYEQGLRAYRQGDVQGAVTLYRKALARGPASAALLTDLGLALGDLSRLDEAEQSFRAAMRKDPVRWYAYVNFSDLIARSEARWERRDEIVALLTSALGRQPPEARVGRSGLLLALARFERSVGRTREATAWLASLRDDELTSLLRAEKLKLADGIAADERARAVEDWPEPEVAPADAAALSAAEKLAASGAHAEALASATALSRRSPAWQAPRFLRARSLYALRSMDEAARELTVLLRLSPSHARAWRLLGEILEAHGGLLEADRADEALRRALALEPSWVDLWRLRAKVALRRGRPQEALRLLGRVSLEPAEVAAHGEELRALTAQAHAQEATAFAHEAQPTRAPAPSADARELLRRAQELLATPPGGTDAQARELLEAALRDSPAFVEAAATLYSVTGVFPEQTARALWDDGDALLDLAARVARIGQSPPANATSTPPNATATSTSNSTSAAGLIAPWVDRAVDLDAPEARFVRAQLREAAGDREGALDDLVRYTAGPQPAHLAEARLLRAALTPPPRADRTQLDAQEDLAADKPAEAQARLAVRCDAAPRTGGEATAARLVAQGRVHEFRGELVPALGCYAAAQKLAPAAQEPLARLARAASRADVGAIAQVEPQLERASAAAVPEADWALARLFDSRGQADGALGRIDRFLAASPPSPADASSLDAARAGASELRARILTARDVARRTQRGRELLGAAALALLLLGAALALLHGSTVASALTQRPALFPAVARAVAEIRHDVLKHRASVLSALADPSFAREEVARSLLSPEPTSKVVQAIYERLRQAARGQGLTLRSLSREPVFGPLYRDLARAEQQLQKPAGSFDIGKLDARVRGLHSERLAGLLKLGPRTRLDAPAITSWIRDLEAELRRSGKGWVSPALQLPGMEVEFPVERAALSVIFANLLRNAQAAAAAAPEGGVVVRLGEERDAAGRRTSLLLVGDSSPHGLTLEAIEERESGRGLAIVRDLTREWHGSLLVRPEEKPWTKAVGACFPLPGGR